jgi:exoribonuclease-2
VAAKLAAPFKPKDADLYAVVQGFDDTYSAYADHQNRMERFWCLRWLQQERHESAVASVVKGDLVRLEEIPLMMHVPGLGVHARGTRLLLEISNFDELMLEASCRVIQVLGLPSPASGQADAADESVDEGSIDAAAEAASGEIADETLDIALDRDADSGPSSVINNNSNNGSDAKAVFAASHDLDGQVGTNAASAVSV